MPRYAQPPETPPPAARRAFDAFGINPFRGAVIQYLIDHPGGQTSGSIQRALNAKYHTVLRNLQGLEESGVVTSDAGEQRMGQRVLYSADPEAIAQALTDLREYFRTTPPPE